MIYRRSDRGGRVVIVVVVCEDESLGNKNDTLFDDMLR
jgi:hypothetical protein